jgi:spermidine synthase
MSLAPSHEQVLVIGGGDGLAMREVLKYKDVGHATLVDLDPAVTHLGQTFERLTELNGNSLNDPRVTVVNTDGYQYLVDSPDLYPVIIVDLPDPRNEALAKLYSKEFYTLVKRHLARGGIFVQQSSSPFFVRKAYWCVAHSAEAAGLNVQTYHAYIPSFGDWGFVMASDLKLDWSRAKIEVPTRFLTPGNLPEMTVFDPDTNEIPTEISTLQNPAVLRYYVEDWRHWRG